MFKLLRRLICLIIIAAIVFVTLSLMSGGEKFRWFGKKVAKESEDLGQKADKLKKTTEGVTKGLEETKKTIEETKETIKGLTGKKDDKAH